MAGDLALASYHDLKGKMIMQVNMKKGNGKNSITSKQFNRGLIFQLIATGTCNTRIELSRRTGLAKTTVTNIVAEFMEKGIVKECEEELAIQYLTTEGLNRLEKGAAFSLDKELSYKISKADRLVRLRNRIDIICRNVEIFSILILCLTLLFLFI